MLQGRTTAWLFFLLLLVSMAALFEKRHLHAGNAGALPSQIVALDVNRAEQLLVETTTVNVSCTKVDGVWEIITPMHWRANSSQISFIIETIARLPPKDRISARQRRNRNLTLVDYGLVVPRAVVTISSPDGHAVIRIGKDTPAGDGVFYMGSSFDDIYIADRILLTMLPQSVEEFRDPALIPNPGSITGIEVRQPGKPAVNLKKNGAEWAMKRPFAIQASRPAIKALLTSIANTTIEKFIWSSSNETGTGTGTANETIETSFGLSPDESTLAANLHFADGSTAYLTFGSVEPGSSDSFYVMSSLDTSVYTVDRAIVDALKMDADTLRERRIFPLPPSDVIATLFTSAKGAFALRLNEDLSTWTISRPSIQPTNQNAATDFISSLLAIEDTSMLTINEAEVQQLIHSDREVVKIDITPTPPHPMFTAYASTIRNESGTPVQYEITVPGENRRHFIPADRLPKDFLQSTWFSSVRDTTVLAIPTESLASISRHSPRDDETVLLGSDGRWFSAKPIPIVSDSETLVAIGELFANFQATGVSTLFAASTAVFGLDPPQLEYIITTRNKKTPIVILLVSPPQDDGSVHVKVKGQDAVFTASPQAAALFARELTLKPAN